jgi:hypothetical protein
MVGVRVGADNHANDLPAGGAPEPVEVLGVGRARGRWRCSRCAGRRPGSCWCRGRSSRRGWVRSGASRCEQRHGLLALPVQRVHDLAVRADQRQLAVGRFVLHVARFAPASQPARGQLVHSGCSVAAQACSTANPRWGSPAAAPVCGWWEDDEELPRPVARQCINFGRTQTGSNCSVSSATGPGPGACVPPGRARRSAAAGRGRSSSAPAQTPRQRPGSGPGRRTGPQTGRLRSQCGNVVGIGHGCRPGGAPAGRPVLRSFRGWQRWPGSGARRFGWGGALAWACAAASSGVNAAAGEHVGARRKAGGHRSGAS